MNPRIKWLRNQLSSLKLEGMIVYNPINVRYLTGLSEEGFLIIGPKENIFVTDSRYIESVNRNLTIDDEIIAYNIKDLSKYDYEAIFMTNENVGFEENYVTYEKYQKLMQTYQVNFVETEGLIENQRIVKDYEEIEKIRKACEITDSAFEYIINNIEEGMTEKEVAFEIQKYMVKNGAIVIDVGMNRNSEGKLVGDVDFENLFPPQRAKDSPQKESEHEQKEPRKKRKIIGGKEIAVVYAEGGKIVCPVQRVGQIQKAKIEKAQILFRNAVKEREQYERYCRSDEGVDFIEQFSCRLREDHRAAYQVQDAENVDLLRHHQRGDQGYQQSAGVNYKSAAVGVARKIERNAGYHDK